MVIDWGKMRKKKMTCGWIGCKSVNGEKIRRESEMNCVVTS